MKNYDEVTKALLERRDRYVAEQKNKQKKIIVVATTLCIVTLIGLGAYKGDFFNTGHSASSEKVVASTAKSDYSENIREEQSLTMHSEKITKKGDTKTPETENQETTQEILYTAIEGQAPLGTIAPTEKCISRIEVTRLPDKTVYYPGDRFDMTGLQVMGYFTTGEVEDITEYIYYYSETADSVSDHCRINVEYTDNTEYINLAYTYFEVVVKEPTISVDESNITLDVGEKTRVSAITEAKGCDITWHTTDSTVVQIDDNGTVTATGDGTASIYAVISYNDFEATSSYCQVTVNSAQTVGE